MTKPEYTTSRVFDLVLSQVLHNGGVEHRSFERISWRVGLKIQPLDSDFQPDGDPYCAISSDVSRGGIGFIYPERMLHEYLRITISDTSVSAIARVIHNTSIGTDEALYLVGTEFLTRD